MGREGLDQPGDAFQRCADEINLAARKAEHDVLERHLRAARAAGEQDGMPLVIAAIAGMISGAGYLCGQFEPKFIFGDALSAIVQAQFDAGREDHGIFSQVPS